MGFGKTTIAKEMAQKLPAVCLTHDEFMVKLYGRNMPCHEFRSDYEKVDAVLWELAAKIIHCGIDVIMDYGFWSHKDREEAFNQAKKITPDVVFHVTSCDMSEAKRRILQRSAENSDELYISEDEFDTLAKRYEPWDFHDDYPVVFHFYPKDTGITKTHFGIYGAVIRNDEILLIKKARGPYTGMFDLPGGSPEQGESCLQTLKREIKEETGCTVVKAQNERQKTIIFSDFTVASGETGVLQHQAILFDVEISGEPQTCGDGLDSNGAVWVKIADLNAKNATPYALIAAGLPVIAVADENDELVACHLRHTPLKANRFPMIAAVLLFNSHQHLILQKIAEQKKWGGLWTYSAAGHVDAGEDYRSAAKRELYEEMGINTEIEDEIAAFPVVRDGKIIAFHHVYLAHSDAPIKAAKEEVAEVKEISLSALREEILQRPQQFFDAFSVAIRCYFEKNK